MPARHQEPRFYGGTHLLGDPQGRKGRLLCERCGTDLFKNPNRNTRLCQDCKSDPMYFKRRKQ